MGMDIENLILRARTMIGYGLSPAEIRDALALDDEGMANLIIMAAKLASKEIEA